MADPWKYAISGFNKGVPLGVRAAEKEEERKLREKTEETRKRERNENFYRQDIKTAEDRATAAGIRTEDVKFRTGRAKATEDYRAKEQLNKAKDRSDTATHRLTMLKQAGEAKKATAEYRASVQKATAEANAATAAYRKLVEENKAASQASTAKYQQTSLEQAGEAKKATAAHRKTMTGIAEKNLKIAETKASQATKLFNQSQKEYSAAQVVDATNTMITKAEALHQAGFTEEAMLMLSQHYNKAIEDGNEVRLMPMSEEFADAPEGTKFVMQSRMGGPDGPFTYFKNFKQILSLSKKLNNSKGVMAAIEAAKLKGKAKGIEARTEVETGLDRTATGDEMKSKLGIRKPEDQPLQTTAKDTAILKGKQLDNAKKSLDLALLPFKKSAKSIFDFTSGQVTTEGGNAIAEAQKLVDKSQAGTLTATEKKNLAKAIRALDLYDQVFGAATESVPQRAGITEMKDIVPNEMAAGGGTFNRPPLEAYVQ